MKFRTLLNNDFGLCDKSIQQTGEIFTQPAQ